MAAPGQMFDHTLDALKGWFAPSALDYVAKLSANVTIDPLPAGRCVHLNSSGQFETGAQLLQMPIFLLQGSADFDVSNPGSTNWQAIAPVGWMSGLVATGAYELQTTEFDSTQTYAPNDHLNAVVANTTAATGGTLTNQSLGTLYGSDMVNRCGVVSRGKSTNAYGKTVVSFWPIYLPGKV